MALEIARSLPYIFANIIIIAIIKLNNNSKFVCFSC